MFITCLYNKYLKLSIITNIKQLKTILRCNRIHRIILIALDINVTATINEYRIQHVGGGLIEIVGQQVVGRVYVYATDQHHGIRTVVECIDRIVRRNIVHVSSTLHSINRSMTSGNLKAYKILIIIRNIFNKLYITCNLYRYQSSGSINLSSVSINSGKATVVAKNIIHNF
ncbi:hypothetical protein AGLY_004325 [Aphis glycines]|uniref:Uncharacterized protein n=1 Tax=Aphis glycines TaxID=307491 RepID=A0A6G0TZ43_APHGL|nr:hypothetical protein AGLY_004325 [Aphis glycines]